MQRTSDSAADGFTPLIAPLHAAVGDALTALFGGPPRRWWAEAADAPVEVLLDGEPALRALVHADAGEGWMLQGGLRVTLRRPEDASALRMPGMRRRLRWLAENLPGRDGEPLRAALAAWRPYARAEDRMYRQRGRSTEGMSGTLRMGFRCSQDCWFCWQSRSWPDPPDELLPIWLEEMLDSGVKLVEFTGGEPTLHRQLPALIQRASERGAKVLLQTNAIRLARPGYARLLRDAGLESVLISLHSADPEVSDRMTRAPRTHARTLAGIAESLSVGLQVGLNCCVEAANYSGLEALADLIVERFARPFPGNPVQVVNFSQPSDYWDLELWKASMVSIEAARPHLVAAVRKLSAAGVFSHAAGACGYPLCTFHEDPELLPLHTRDEFSEQDLSARSFAPPCETCTLQQRCPGVRDGYLETFGSAGIRPFTA